MSLCKISRYIHTCVYKPEPPPSCAEPSGQPTGTNQVSSLLVVGEESAAQCNACCVPGCKVATIGGGLDLTLGNVVHRDSQASASKSRGF